jgi:hypothetical protein
MGGLQKNLDKNLVLEEALEAEIKRNNKPEVNAVTLLAMFRNDYFLDDKWVDKVLGSKESNATGEICPRTENWEDLGEKRQQQLMRVCQC